ncbi:Germin-like protein 1-2 [Porphyridium purpureum]|uniref:Germin-like protein 1-2 n=1 Tax=Porphyridium purpureum TaxID=35688 RepID=A0A5J4ZA64_PORPP|nr:Germin-like protein 1-2 [Porphyridium purpureum]|eukprot:POR8358..scf295_1
MACKVRQHSGLWILVVSVVMAAAATGVYATEKEKSAEHAAPHIVDAVSMPKPTEKGMPQKFSASDFTFDSNLGRYAPNTVGPGGEIINAELPVADAEEHCSTAIVNLLKPGSLNLAHTHPRASEIVYVTKGIVRLGISCPAEEYGYPPFIKEFDIPQDGFGFVPQSCLHFEVNVGYGEAQFVAFFDHHDPGVVTFPQALWALDKYVDKALLKLEYAPHDFKQQLKDSHPKNIGSLSPYACDTLDAYSGDTGYELKSCGHEYTTDTQCEALGCCYVVADGVGKCTHAYAHLVHKI